jgi:hypothetical protein
VRASSCRWERLSGYRAAASVREMSDSAFTLRLVVQVGWSVAEFML